MRSLKYRECRELANLLYKIGNSIGIEIRVSLGVVVSKGARAKAYARIYGLPIPIQRAHGIPPLYTVEFLCEKIDRLGPDEVAEVAIHELLHIPEGQKGGLRPHGKKVNSRITKIMLKKADQSLKFEIYEVLRRCCEESI
ncbi:MAG: metallopeptidase [Thermoprotei archaeon]|jgi:predicted metallopeptidase|nr:metallopeptidase [Thermoprotei archaeon]